MDKLVHYCVSGMRRYNVIEKNQESVIRYGLDLLFSSVISITVLLFLGMVVNKLLFTVALLGAFIPLQSFGGGFHCQTHARCFGVMLVGYMFVIFGMAKVPTVILWCGAVCCAFAFLKLAPVKNAKAPFGEAFGERMRKIVVRIYLIVMVLAMMVRMFSVELDRPLLCAVIMSGISITTAKIRQSLRSNF